MAMTQTFSADKILTQDGIDGHNGVVRKIYWTCEFSMDGKTSMARGQNWLDISDLSNFTEIGSVTDEQLETWIQQELGMEWTHICEFHERHLSQIIDESALSVYRDNGKHDEPTKEKALESLKSNLIALGVSVPE